MNLKFNTKLSKEYKNPAQIARVLTEDWVLRNSYCPSCGYDNLSEFQNNKPVADFFCFSCNEEYELKSKKGNSLGKKINDGAYSKMIERINSLNNPNFFLLNYNRETWSVQNFLIIPKQFFVDDIIEKKKPLPRPDKLVQCNIEIHKIPEAGKVFLVKNANPVAKEKVISQWKSVSFLKKTKKKAKKGWYLDTLRCLDKIPNERFSLNQVYAFEKLLQAKYPENKNIRAKIRQQLQDLRNNNVIEFLSKGNYRKIQL